jgi:transcriptional regulator with XRE-family HTH domain
MPDSFGARLRERREQQQVALSAIAEQTKIKLALLEALERDDVSHWPSGIFRRAFIRAYALAIGLDPDATLREFLDLYPDPIEVVSPVLAAAAGVDGPVADGTNRLKGLVASAIGTVSRLRPRAILRPAFAVEAQPPAIPAIKRPMVDAPPVPLVAEPALVFEPAMVAAPEVPQIQTAATLLTSAPDTKVPEIPPAVVIEPIAEAPLLPLVSPDPDLLAVAHVCTELACVQTMADVPPVLYHMTKVLDAIGLVLWMWDPIANELRPTLAHGYSDRVVAQLPRVDRDSNNATAAAFRAGETCIVTGDDVDNGALAVPLVGPDGCAGVLAIELPERREEKESVRAHAMIFAAQLSTLLGMAQPVEASGRLFA